MIDMIIEYLILLVRIKRYSRFGHFPIELLGYPYMGKRTKYYTLGFYSFPKCP